MVRTRPRALAISALIACGSLACGAPSSDTPPPPKAPLYTNLGNHHFAITTTAPEAQKYFDQGVTLSYAFNHAEAIRAFKQAAAIDPACAMCYWGIAFALGPNINAPITEDAAREASSAIERAGALAAGISDRERAYIDALAKRYAADPKAERAPLDRAYAEAMRGVAARFPDDPEAATLFAQSLMDTSPWNYWDGDGKPRELTGDVLAALESVLARHPNHIGAMHLYIHAVEASPDPARAEKYADALPALVPGAGHIVHMPAHIYLRTGRYHDASVANQRALAADEAYFAGDAVPGNMMYQVNYLPHNIHFFVTSASMEGRRADALAAANQVREKIHADMLRDPSMAGMVQHMTLTPLFTRMRFGLWDEVLAEPSPVDDMPYMRAVWHAARALAHLAKGDVAAARTDHASLARLKDDRSLTTLYVSSVNTAAAIAALAHDIVAAEVAVKENRPGEAVRAYARAVEREDALTYMEPPDWPIPVRQLQGAALLALGRFSEAEAAFRGDMRKFPENGWSLSGLKASLERQGRRREAVAVDERLARAWARADVPVPVR